MAKARLIDAELARCQVELAMLGKPWTGNDRLIISTGDISDVDGMFALAQYAKTGFSVLFVMNYPAYVGLPDGQPLLEGELGLGYTYGTDVFLNTSNEALVRDKKVAQSAIDAYMKVLNKFPVGSTTGEKVMGLLTNLAYDMVSEVWKAAGATGRLFFCVGGINSVNPFSAAALKNELFVYSSRLKKVHECRAVKEGDCVNHLNVLVQLEDVIQQYDSVWMDFNGSAAFLDGAWHARLTGLASTGKLRGCFVQGGVLADSIPQTMSSIPGTLNRLSCATMNQLYHPANTAALFGLLQPRVPVYVAPNNCVPEVKVVTKEKVTLDDGWINFLRLNGILSRELYGWAKLFYGSVYNPPQKPFDFYTALALTSVADGLVAGLTNSKCLFYDSVRGVTVLGGLNWPSAREQYARMIERKLGSDLLDAFKPAFRNEIAALQSVTTRSIGVVELEYDTGDRGELLVSPDLHVLRRLAELGTFKTEGCTFKSRMGMAERDMFEAVFKQAAFRSWWRRMDVKFKSRINFISILDMFFFRPGVLGFCNVLASTDTYKPELDADGVPTGKQLTVPGTPGYCFIRGGAVAVLMIVEAAETGEKFLILTRQPRTPIGNSRALEIPAGMMDADNNFSDVVCKEIKEEVGLDVYPSEFVDLSGAFHGAATGMYPSSGGCDEFLRLFSWRKKLPMAKITEMHNRRTGNAEEGEKIRIEIVKWDSLVHSTDAKALSAGCLFFQMEHDIIALLYKLQMTVLTGDTAAKKVAMAKLFEYNADMVYDLAVSEFTGQSSLQREIGVNTCDFGLAGEQRMWVEVGMELQGLVKGALTKNIKEQADEAYLDMCTRIRSRLSPLQVKLYFSKGDTRIEGWVDFNSVIDPENKKPPKWKPQFGLELCGVGRASGSHLVGSN